MEYEIRSEGLLDFDIRMRAEGEDWRDAILTALDRASHQAGMYMGTHVPRGETGRLFRAINVGPVTYRPGGAGGGGFYEVHVGVDTEQAPHALFVLEGTGIHHEGGSRGNITASKGNFMAINKEGEGIIYRQSAEGQLPQREWFDDAQDIADRVVRRELNKQR
jgi:hypothetical protein